MRTLLLPLLAVLPGLLSAQFFSDSITLAEQRLESFDPLVPTGRADAPVFYASEDGDLVVLRIEDGTIVTDTTSFEGGGFLDRYTRYDDMNGDGILDVVGRFGRVAFGQADSTFAPNRDFAAFRVSAFGDWNGDGITDYAAHNDAEPFGPNGEMFIVQPMRDSTGFQLDTVDFDLGDRGGADFFDMDADGDLDFCYVGGDFPNTALICLNNDGSGNYTREIVIISDLRGSDLVTADFTGDGFGDIIHEGFFSEILMRVSNEGRLAGSSSRVVYNDNTVRYRMLLGEALDVDGDEDLDLVAILKPSDGDNLDIAYFLNDGTGNFTAPVVIGEMASFSNLFGLSTCISDRQLHVVDLNNDGRKDILINNDLRAENNFAYLSLLEPLSLPTTVATARELIVYPNPTDGRTLRFELPTGRTAHDLYLVDATGRTVAVPFVAGSNRVEIGTRPSGVYTLLLVDDQRSVYRSRLVVQR